MDGREVDGRRLVVLVLCGALCLAALVLIINVGGGYQANSNVLKIVPAALALVLIAPCAFAGVRLAERRPRMAGLGYGTAALATLAFAVIALHIADSGIYGGGSWHFQGVLLALTLAGAQICLILSYHRSDDPPVLLLLTLATAFAILVFGVLAAYETADHGSQVSQRTFAILGIFYMLGVALLVVLRVDQALEGRVRVGSSLALDHVVIAVSDRVAATNFYGVLLGAEVVQRPGGRIAFRVGEQLLNVHEPGVAAEPLARDPVRPGNSDLCFVWPGTPEQAVRLVRELGAELVAGPVAREGAGGQGTSVYTRDPDGSLIELIAY